MSPDQVDAVKAIVAEWREAMNQAATVPSEVLHDARGLTPEKRAALLQSKTVKAEVENCRDAVIKVRKTAMQTITKRLTEKQSAYYEKMLGEPFDFTKTWPNPSPTSLESERKKESL
jgi:hypothetical protein